MEKTKNWAIEIKNARCLQFFRKIRLLNIIINGKQIIIKINYFWEWLKNWKQWYNFGTYSIWNNAK